MTDERKEEYYGLCPDKEHKAFERGVKEIVEDVLRSDRIRQFNKHPSKVKRELEQLGKALRKLSLEARSSLGDMTEDTPFSSPLRDLQMRIDLAVNSQRKGRSKYDAARLNLCRYGASLWTTHGGDLEASGYETFLEGLIDKAGFGGEGKVRIDSVALVEEMREEFTNYDPPRWDRDDPLFPPPVT